MISDWSIATKVDTLQDYYTQLYALQAKAHGDGYMLVHKEIKERLKDCSSYTEFGINQGATLAVALMENTKVIRAYDIKLDPYNPAKHLFDAYASENNIDYKVFEENTLKCNITPTDLLYIDSLHLYDHLRKELTRHSDKAKKYIIFHDTVAFPGVNKAAREYLQTHNNWKIVTDCKDNTGFLTIKRV